MPRGRGGGRGGPQPRSVLVSKALSRLLRHAAVEERIPIDNHGYVRMDHLLGWQRLRSMKPPVDFAEVVEVVEGNEKKRFALKFVGSGYGPAETAIESDTKQPEPQTELQIETQTQRAISQFESTSSSGFDAKQFFIRATQGHSMETVEAENLLTPISLDDPATIPDTVVHGTFYGAWEHILQSGGLKSMRRNHVHFATGPSLQEALPGGLSEAPAGNGAADDTGDGKGKDKDAAQPQRLGEILGKNKVISGMRSDAQILIYIDIHRALAEEKDMKWWKSENGVILTDGVASIEGGTEKLVPTKYFLAAVEIKEGVGLLYEAGKGAAKELPERLKSRSVPRGKGGGPRGGRGRGRS
ncbi:tRNA 2'-phosphotransferase [Cladophialophora chaetospira]|uniref:2'-phosphotransferase n=1 Tax=Cladophialophora chaetospira TaxID=386627 RepID=A0AA38U7U7_9EURO|nr:tRNA 2'-phosphotransferase [Cladophialophora chaetospira]